MNVAVVILNWNDTERTLACLDSVLSAAEGAQKTCNTHIWVVDNGSSPPFKSAARASKALSTTPSLKILRNKENFGFAKGMNTGIAAALDQKCDLIWLLNNDTEVDQRAISALVDHKQLHPHQKIIGSVILDPVTRQVMTVGGYRYWTCLGMATPVGRGLTTDHLPKAQPKVDYMCGSALWLDAQFASDNGGLPEDNFLYFEELNLTRKLDADEAMGICLGARVYHHQGVTTDKLPNQQKGYFATLAALRYTGKVSPVCLLSVACARVMIMIARSLKHRNMAHLMACLTAIRDYCFAPNKADGQSLSNPNRNHPKD